MEECEVSVMVRHSLTDHIASGSTLNFPIKKSLTINDSRCRNYGAQSSLEEGPGYSSKIIASQGPKIYHRLSARTSP